MLDINKITEMLTIEEKACLLAGHLSWYSNKISRVGLPSIVLTDGPHGLRKKKSGNDLSNLGISEPATCFPAACTTGSSWNRQLLYKLGQAMAEECLYYDVNLILGPAVNIKRNPLCGRNFEYFSEDPLITGDLGAKLTRGIEDMGVGTSVKHFACNNNEKNRMYGNSIVDERAFREIYLKAFEPVIKTGKPQSVMCAYNKINGKYASENQELLNGILRDDWGFEGLVMSDWGAVNDRIDALKAGLDLEMPGDVAHNRQMIINAVNEGKLEISVLDTAVRRVLNIIQNTSSKKDKTICDFDSHTALAECLALDSAVLLKNNKNTLPLDENKKYLIVGEMFEKMRYQGSGSSLINPFSLCNPKDAFDRHGVNYSYEQGYSLNSFEDDALLVQHATVKAEYFDTIIFFGGLSEYAESEGFDRDTLSLPKNQLNLLNRLAKLNKKIIFVMYTGSPVDTEFDINVDALLNMYLPGESGGEATYKLLFGRVNPSGKLSETWPEHYEDVPFGGEFTKTTSDRYKESIFVGYRYYSSFNVPVKYPFGYGLSYTSFEYSNMYARKTSGGYRVSVDVENTGKMPGSTVAEIYVEAPKTNVVKPIRELCGFEKVYLEAGEKKTVSIEIPIDNLKHYINGEWVLENGKYQLHLCSDVNTVIHSSAVNINDGVEYCRNDMYTNLYAIKREKLLSMTDEQYDSLVGRTYADDKVEKYYDLNTPMREYKTFFGKIIYRNMINKAKRNYYKELRTKDGPDKITRVKNAYFGWRNLEGTCLRALAFTSEGSYSYNKARAMCDLANNRPFRALKRMLKGEKCVKLPK